MRPVPSPLSRRLRRRPLFSLLTTALLASVLAAPAAHAQMVHLLPKGELGARVAARLRMPRPRPIRPIQQILVKLRPGVALPDFIRAVGPSTKTLPPLSAGDLFSARGIGRGGLPPRPALPAPIAYQRSNDAIGWHLFQLRSPRDLDTTLAALKKRADVLHAEPNWHVSLCDPPNDTYWGLEDLEHLIVVLAGLDDVSTARDDDSSYWTYTWSLETVNSLAAWEAYPGHYPTADDRVAESLTTDGSGMPLVAVIDTGIDYTHPDFSYTGNPLNGFNDTDSFNGGQINTFSARNLIGGNTDTDPFLAIDDFGHGTSVAGIIGAAPNNNLGIPGLGFPGQIVPIKVIDANGNGDDSDLLDAITYAADAQCLIINMSLNLDTTQFPQALQDAVDYAWSKGSLPIAAAGNDAVAGSPLLGQTRRYPASCVHVLAVAATAYGGPDTVSGEIAASYSNSGLSIGVAAPGGDVTTFHNTAPNAADLGLDPIQEYVLIWTLAPTYSVRLSNPDDPEGVYAALGLYGLNYGAVPARRSPPARRRPGRALRLEEPYHAGHAQRPAIDPERDPARRVSNERAQ